MILEGASLSLTQSTNDERGFETRRSARALAGRPLQPSPTRADSRAEALE